jgi:hypothetical protein
VSSLAHIVQKGDTKPSVSGLQRSGKLPMRETLLKEAWQYRWYFGAE